MKHYLSRGHYGVAGFTLVELMITVAIVGILAAIAYPSYQEQVAASRRNEAATALLTGAQALERYYSSNGRYTTTAGGNTLPAVFPTTVPENGTAYYTIAASGTPTANSFTLKATRTGVMASDGCGNLTLDEAGINALESASKTVAQCWRR
ncbi:type IV pilin protein [Spongiibacter sp. KMU-158]|uniref:Type IV pilin protein n=1 Tax=Spongiibacter pelagi TaxID=2760804 RepID=A0A927C4R6_9GAMM|nr:type IV pilin protein [Spongiibacter pelagi]MBD2859872.1 type IV pilin protein [Spongiibacter pelagi]